MIWFILYRHDFETERQFIRSLWATTDIVKVQQ